MTMRLRSSGLRTSGPSFWMGRFLITGASGFLGRSLVRQLRALSHEVVELSSRSGDIADPNIFTALRNDRFDRVFHLAGKTYVPDSWKTPAEFLRINCIGTANVLAFCKEHSAPVTVASAYVYGIPRCLPISENEPPRPNNPYALSKHLAEQICEFYSRVFDLPITVLHIFNVFGRGQDDRFLVPTIIRQARERGVVELDDLSPRRDYVYSKDVVSALISTLSMDRGYNVFNIGSGVSHSVAEVVEAIRATFGISFKISCRGLRREHEIDNVVADISRARKGLGWSPAYSFADGLKDMLVQEQTP